MNKFNQVEEMESAASKIKAYQSSKITTNGFVAPETNQQQSKDKLTIEFEKEEFIGAHKTLVTTSLKLAQNIANKLAKVFSDLAGAIIVPGSKGQPELILYFRDTPAREGMTKALVLIKDKYKSNTNDYSESVQSLMAMQNLYKTSRLYDLSDDAKSALSRFMYKDGNNNINWGQRISEAPANGMRGGEILVKVIGLNLIEFIKAIYGYKYKSEVNGQEVKNYIDYTVNLLQPVNSPFNLNNYNSRNLPLTDYAISISALDRTELQKVAQIFGQPATYGTTPMCIPEI